MQICQIDHNFRPGFQKEIRILVMGRRGQEMSREKNMSRENLIGIYHIEKH